MTEDLKNLAFEMQGRGIPPRYFAAQMRRGMSAQEIFATWPPQTRLDRVGSRRSRRRLVLAAYGGWLLVALLAKLFSSPDSAFLVIPLVGVASAVAVLILLNRRTFLNREVLAGDLGLDERLVQNRNQALSHRLSGICSGRSHWLDRELSGHPASGHRAQPEQRVPDLPGSGIARDYAAHGHMDMARARSRRAGTAYALSRGVSSPDRNPALVSALGTFVEPDHRVRPCRVRVHRAQLHWHR